MAILFNSPAVAVIDQLFNMTLSWTPVADALTGSYSAYNHWDITTQVGANPPLVAKALAPGFPAFLGGSQTYTQTLSAGITTLTMQAFSSVDDSAPILPPWQTNGSNTARRFPDPLLAASVAFSLTSVLLNQPLTVTLSSAYATQAGNTANQWQIIWPDGTMTGWLPLSSNVVTKQFTAPGTFNVFVQTRVAYTGSQYAPPSTLIRQFSQQLLVVNQQAPSSSGSSSGLTGSLGIGGQQGFEIVGTSGTNVTPEPWEVIVRAIVRDTVTNELKLLIGTTRFSNASSLLGTAAFDVFPMEGRPHAKELIQPPYELTTTSQTETVPVSIATSVLPDFIVGKSVTQALGGVFQMTTSGTSGIAPFIWSSAGLPLGLTLNGSGVINGTPLELGVFQVTFTVQDSSVPFSIAEVTLALTVETDLLVEIAPGQTDAKGNTLVQLGTTLGVAQVNTPYSVLMAVGNINPSVSTPGGLPPYTWSIPAGALPVGLSINPSTGLISGSPSTYNSTTDFNTIFSATVQVTDAIGAKATQTYTMTLIPAVLSYGLLDQPIIYASQQFKLVVPVFGGTSPYSLVSLSVPTQDSAYYGAATLVDGQVNVDVNFPEAATGQHTFTLTVHDSATPTPAIITSQFTVTVQPEISDPFLVPAYISYSWKGPLDVNKPVPLALTGNLAGFALGGLAITLDQAAVAVGGFTTYTDTSSSCSFGGGAGNAYAGFRFVVSGFQNAANNGVFMCGSSTATTLTLANPSGVAETISISLTLTQATPVAGSVANPQAPFAPATLYAGTITGGVGNAYAGQSFTVIGFVNGGNNGTFYCVASTATTITLSNSNGVAETHAGSAHQQSAKALQVNTTAIGYPLANGVTVAIDPTIPEVEFTGPPSAVFGNSQYAVPVQLQLNGATQATVSQTYTVLAANTSSPFVSTDIGAIASNTRPYLFGAGQNELVGLNPRKPYYNSPDVPPITPSPAPTDAPWLAVVQAGSLLPPGLNLDTNTGLVYGNLVGPYAQPSVIQYVGKTGTVHGTVTLTWNTLSSSFSLLDNITDGVAFGTPYPATSYIAVPASAVPSAASIVYGRLPQGLLFTGTPVGQNFLITGAAIEAGYFDIWFTASTTSGQSAFLRHRFSIDFLAPLTIINTSPLPSISNLFYDQQLQAVGGIAPYAWSASDVINGAWAVIGTSAAPTIGNFVGLTLNTVTGVLSGTLTTPPAVPTDLGSVTITLTDSRTPTPATTSSALDLPYNNALRITTANIATVVPLADDPLGTGDYSFQMQAAGGAGPTAYKWEITPAATIPTGITPASGTTWNGTAVLQSGGGGLFGGTYTGAFPSTFPISVTLTDGVSTPFTQAFTVNTGLDVLTIDISGVGPIPPGFAYQGTLSSAGLCTQPPVQWQVAPTPQYPLTLSGALPGLSLSVNGDGTTATVSGTYSGPPIAQGSPTHIRFIAVDSVGDTGVVVVPFYTHTALTISGWQTVTPPSATLAFPLPHAFVSTPGGWAYSTPPYSGPIQLIATNGIGALVWGVTPSLTPYGLSLVTSGVNAGQLLNTSATSFLNVPFTFTVTDSIGNTTSLVLDISSQASGLVITTTSIGAFLAGTAYTTSSEPAGLPLAASLGVPPYTFSISPVSANPLPTGLTITSAGYITGTTIQGGYSKPVTFRVTDNIGSYSDKVLTITVTEVLALYSGIDYVDWAVAGNPRDGAWSSATNYVINDIALLGGLSYRCILANINHTPPNATYWQQVGVLGYVDAGNVSSINPRPNLSFYVVATGVVSTSPSQITVTVSDSGITGTVTSLDTVHETAQIQLTGSGFDLGAGTYPISVTVVDSGVSITGIFTWTVFNDGTMTLAPTTGSLPTQALG